MLKKIVFENGKTLYTDEYANIFFGDDIRPSCYECKYTSLHRPGDITIGDCWGGEKIYPRLADKTGASLVLIGTEKGRDLFEQAHTDIISFRINIEDVLQPRLIAPEKLSETYYQFWRDYCEMPFPSLMSKYSFNNYSVANTILKKIKRVISLPYRVIRKITKVIIK